MPMTRILVPRGAAPAELAASFDALRAEHDLSPEYPADAVAEARAAMAAAVLPERDETAVPFFTIDPAGSMDLDQVMHLEREGDGYRVRYAITDVPLYVRPGGVLDAETRRRGETIYLPDMRIPLHPTELSEGAASLLPDQVCSAFVWDMHLDAQANVQHTELYRARVRSVERLDYTQVQSDVDAAGPSSNQGRQGGEGQGGAQGDPRFVLLREIGEARAALELARGGASLPMPEQEVSEPTPGQYEVHFRPPVPSEDWNAQISLMTGMVAADIMLKGGVGILRTMPKADERDVERFRRQAEALGVSWPADQTYGAFLRSLDRDNPRHLALIHEATSLFRGAAYTPFDGGTPSDAEAEQAAVAAPYAHVTAPLRRLVDRFGLVICEALANGREVPGWAREALPDLPAIMKTSDALAGSLDRACVDRVEAAVLSQWVGQTFDAFVVDAPAPKASAPDAPSTDVPSKADHQAHAESGSPGLEGADKNADKNKGSSPKKAKVTVQLTDHAVVAGAGVPDGVGAPGLGEACVVRLLEADLMTGTLTFEVAEGDAAADGARG